MNVKYFNKCKSTKVYFYDTAQLFDDAEQQKKAPQSATVLITELENISIWRNILYVFLK